MFLDNIKKSKIYKNLGRGGVNNIIIIFNWEILSFKCSFVESMMNYFSRAVSPLNEFLGVNSNWQVANSEKMILLLWRGSEVQFLIDQTFDSEITHEIHIQLCFSLTFENNKCIS